jgi:hypothetical protein
MLVFQSGGTGGAGGPTMRGGLGDVSKEVVVRVQEIASWFEDFDIDQIEISISGCVSSGSILKLIISAQGEGGVTLTLKPKTHTKDKSPDAPTG